MLVRKSKIGPGALVVLALTIPLVPANSAFGGIDPTCTNPEEIGFGGTATSRPHGAHVGYETTQGAFVSGQDGCAENAVVNTSSFVFTGGSDDGLGVSGTFLYARAGGVTITDPTPESYDPLHCTTSGCTYADQGSGVSCMSPNATPHHGADTRIFVQDLALGAGVDFSVVVDWARSHADVPPPPPPPPDPIGPERDTINNADPTSNGGTQKGVILSFYDNWVRPQPVSDSLGPGNDPPDACGDGTIEPCPAGVDENHYKDPDFPQEGCNNLDHAWGQPAVPGRAVNSWSVTQAGATVNGVSATHLGSIAGADGAVGVFVDGPVGVSQVQIWTGT